MVMIRGCRVCAMLFSYFFDFLVWFAANVGFSPQSIEHQDAMLFEEIESSNRKERELAYETDVLRGEMENLKRFIPLTRQPGQLGFLEYTPAVVPSSSAAHSKHDRVSPDIVCYYGSDNTDSETALQLSYANMEVGQNKTLSKLLCY